MVTRSRRDTGHGADFYAAMAGGAAFYYGLVIRAG